MVVVAKPTRQQVVALHLDRMLAQPDFPAFGENIQEVMVQAGNDETSMRQITNLILKDLSLTLKVLRTANTPYYNRSGRTILTVTHAVALLGLETIRHLAGSMMLFQHYRGVSPGLKELMLLSLLSAAHGRTTAARIGYRRREEAYLCGMFRNLGEVLVACYLPGKYTAILTGMHERSQAERESCLRVLKCTYEELGVAAATHWRVPERVTGCIRAEFPRLTRYIPGEDDVLSALTSFSHGLTWAIHRKEPQGIRARLNHLLETHGSILGVRMDDIQEIAAEAIAETSATFELLHIPLDDLRLRKQMELAIETMVREGSPARRNDDDQLCFGAALLEGLVGEVESLVTSGNGVELNNILLMVLEALCRGVPFDRAVFALVSPDHSTIRGRLGLGDGSDGLLETFHFPLDARHSPLTAALLTRQDLFRRTSSSSYGLYPVVVDRLVVGCLYAESDEPMNLEPAVERLVSRLRDLAATAIARKRASGLHLIP